MQIFKITSLCTKAASAQTNSGKPMMFLTFNNHFTVPVFGDAVDGVKGLGVQDKVCEVTIGAKENDKGFMNYNLIHIAPLAE